LLREVSDTVELAELAESTPLRGGAPVTDLVGGAVDATGRVAVADGLSVAVHREGPLKTTLRATRASAPPVGPRREVVHAA
jgi:hypothetical protein